MNNEKKLICTETDYEKSLVERNRLTAELDRLTKKETQDRCIKSELSLSLWRKVHRHGKF